LARRFEAETFDDLMGQTVSVECDRCGKSIEASAMSVNWAKSRGVNMKHLCNSCSQDAYIDAEKHGLINRAEGILTKSEWDSYADKIKDLENELTKLENQSSFARRRVRKSDSMFVKWRSWIGLGMPSDMVRTSQDLKIYQKMMSLNEEIGGLMGKMYPDGMKATYTDEDEEGYFVSKGGVEHYSAEGANPSGGATGDQIISWEHNGLSSPSGPPSDIFWADENRAESDDAESVYDYVTQKNRTCAWCGGTPNFMVYDLPTGPHAFCTELHFTRFVGLYERPPGYYGFEAENYNSTITNKEIKLLAIGILATILGTFFSEVLIDRYREDPELIDNGEQNA